MWMLTLKMLSWAWGSVRKPSLADARNVSPGAFVFFGVALVALAVFLVWKPFKVRIPGGVMTVSECGLNLSQMRAEVLEKGFEKQKEAVRAAETERDKLARERSEAVTRAAALAEALEALKREEGGKAVCLPADLVRKWNRGNYR